MTFRLALMTTWVHLFTLLITGRLDLSTLNWRIYLDCIAWAIKRLVADSFARFTLGGVAELIALMLPTIKHFVALQETHVTSVWIMLTLLHITTDLFTFMLSTRFALIAHFLANILS